MIAIKDIKMPKSCCKFHKDTGMIIHCPLYNSCDKRTTIKVNFKPIDCPLAEIVACKDCKHNGTMYCKCFMCDGNEYMSYHNPNFFCADGERKE